MVQDQKCSLGKGKWGELYGLSLTTTCKLTPLCTGVHWKSFIRCWTSVRPHWQMSHLCRPGKCAYLTDGLHCHMGSSWWSPGLWWGSYSFCLMVILDFVQIHSFRSLWSWEPHTDKPHHEHDTGEGDRCPSNAMCKHLAGLSLDSLMSYQLLWKMTKLPLECQTLFNMMK